jgi:hypothetical protein
MGFLEIRRFKDFYLTESRNYSPSVKTLDGNSLVKEDSGTWVGNSWKGSGGQNSNSGTNRSKEESYRSIAYKLSEIFGLYGFFFGQKPGFISDDNWSKLMGEIVAVKDPAAKWDTIIKMTNFLQQKVASPAMKPTTRGEFGYRGDYDYAEETADLPQAAGFLKSASNAAFKSFTPEEQKKSLEILDGILKETKPLTFQKNTNPVTEGQRYLPPSQSDLMVLADSIGAKLLNMYSMLDNLKVAYPGSEAEIDSFLNSSVIPNVDKIRAIIQTDIPNVGDKATVGYMKKLTDFDASITALIPKSEALKDKIVKTFQPIAASREFEESAQRIIDKVREGILKQSEDYARKKKAGDVVAGETDIRDPRNSGDAQVAGSTPAKSAEAAKSQKRKQNLDDLSDFLSKKYQKRG